MTRYVIHFLEPVLIIVSRIPAIRMSLKKEEENSSAAENVSSPDKLRVMLTALLATSTLTGPFFCLLEERIVSFRDVL